MTVRQQVAFSIPPASRQTRSDRRRAVASVLDEVGLCGLSDRLPRALSGGEKQRVAWARAIACDPALLFLDEPLTSLDPLLKEELLQAVIRYGQRPGRTIVLVTHDVDVAKRMGSRILPLTRSSGS